MTRIEPIDYEGVETLSFRQLDTLNGFVKGTTFRCFKAARELLVEGEDYFHLPFAAHGRLIETLKARSQIYASTMNLVLLTKGGYTKLIEYQGGPDQGTESRF